MQTKRFKTYYIREQVKGVYVIGIRMRDQLVDVTKDTNKARKYREDNVYQVLQKLQVLCAKERWLVNESGEEVELHYTDDAKEYRDAVIKGILDGFTPTEKSGPHAVDAKYIEDMITAKKDEDGAEDLPYGEYIPTTWGDCYQNKVWIEDAVEQMLPGCLTLYRGHMSVL